MNFKTSGEKRQNFFEELSLLLSKNHIFIAEKSKKNRCKKGYPIS